MANENRRQVRVPRRLWDEMMLALDQSLTRIETLAADTAFAGEPPSVVTRQIHDFGQRVLTEARRRTE